MLTPLSVVPSRQNPSTFSDDMDAFLNWLILVYLPWANSIENSFQFTATNGTSTTSVAITTGSKSLTTQINKAWAVGSYVYLVNSSDVSKLMVGQVTAYNNGTGALTVNVTTTLGSGTYATWSIGLAVPDVAALNLSGGGAGTIPYQSAASTTAQLAAGAANAVLQSSGAAAPAWVAPQSLVASADALTGNNFPRKSQVDALIAASNPDASSATKGHVELATVGELQSGSGAGLVVDVPTLRSGLIVSASAVATTSGTAVTLDAAVPSWAKRGTICFRGVSLSGTANYLIQLGTSGGFVSAGYSSYFGYVVNDTNANTASSTAGFGISGGNPSGTIHGIMHIALMGTNTWASSHSAGDLGGSGVKNGGGSVDLGAALTQIRITSSGADTFDAGSASVLWE